MNENLIETFFDEVKKPEVKTFSPNLVHYCNLTDEAEDDSSPTHGPHQQESTFYGNNLIEYDDNSCDSFAPAQKRSVSIGGDSKTRSRKSYDQSTDSLDVYDFNETDGEPASKKRRRTKQPTKRNKPAPFPRIKTPETPRREKSYTVGRGKSITPPKVLKKTGPQIHAKALENLAKINATSNTAKVPDAFKPPAIPMKKKNGVKKPRKLYTPTLVDDIDDEEQEVNVESSDINGNFTACPCIQVHEKEQHLTRKLETIAKSANQALVLYK